MKTLSICIATYNRSKDLKELILEILNCNNDDYLVEVTDDRSTDNTVDMLMSLAVENPGRILLHENQVNLGGNNNMIQAIFNCTSKYCFYLNDRDSFDSSKLDLLIELLQNGDYSYVHVIAKSQIVSKGAIEIYDKGFDSIMHHPFACHPSGMIYHVDLVHKNLRIKNYINMQCNMKHPMIAFDLMSFEKSAKYELGIWDFADGEYLAKHVSASIHGMNRNPERLDCHPAQIERHIRNTLDHILVHKSVLAEYTEYEVVRISESILDFFFMDFFAHKTNMFSKSYCMHYQVKRSFISTYKMIYEFKKFYVNVVNIIKELELPDDVINYWGGFKPANKHYWQKLCKVVYKSLKNDVAFLLKRSAWQ